MHQFLARVFTPRGRRPTTYNPVIWGRRDSRRADNILYIVSKPSDPALPLPPPATATPPPPSASAACHSRLATEHSSAHRRRPAQPHVHSHLPQHSRLHSRLPPATAQGWGACREALITRDWLVNRGLQDRSGPSHCFVAFSGQLFPRVRKHSIETQLQHTKRETFPIKVGLESSVRSSLKRD